MDSLLKEKEVKKWNYEPVYEFMKHEKNSLIFKCQYCSKEISCTEKSRSNLRRHLVSVHQKKAVDQFDKIAKDQEKRKKLECKGQKSMDSYVKSKNVSSEVSQKRLDTLITEFIVFSRTSLPLSLVRILSILN